MSKRSMHKALVESFALIGASVLLLEFNYHDYHITKHKITKHADEDIDQIHVIN